MRIEHRMTLALLGANGSGKSSLAYTIMGCEGYLPTQGELRLDGQSINALPLHERARRGITLAWQEPARIEGLSVAEYVALGAPHADSAAALRDVGLEPERYLGRAVDKTLSGGERKRIELAAVLAMQPRLAMLDEPTEGIDLPSLEEMLRVVDRLKEAGGSVLLITHQEQVAAHADEAAQLCGGRIVSQGAPAAVIANYKSRRCTRCDGERCGYERA